MKKAIKMMVLILITVFSISTETPVPAEEMYTSMAPVEEMRRAPRDNPLLPPDLNVPFNGTTLLYYTPLWEQAWE